MSILYFAPFAQFIFAQDEYRVEGKSEDESLSDFSQENSDETEAQQPITLTGSYRLNFGVEDNDFIWKKADYVLQQGTWRYLYGEKRYNTYDPAIYNQLKLGVNAPLNENFSFYAKVVIEPWSFVGTTEAITLPTYYGTTNANDPIEIKLKYWSNNARIYPEIVRSQNGDSFALPEIKVVDGKTRPTTVEGNWESGTAYVHRINIPELKMDREIKPMRSLGVDLIEDEYRFKVFLYAEADLGLYSDDLLRLSGNHIIWEPSPWLDKWQPGKFYTATGWENGIWTRNLVVKNSDGDWLTLLRGLRFHSEGTDYYGNFMVATPLDLWDDDGLVNNVPLALRIKKDLSEYLSLGTVYTSRFGYDLGSMDAFDQAAAFDTEITLFEEHKLGIEAALSKNAQNLNTEEYKTRVDDYAYQALYAAEVVPFEMPVLSKLSYTYMGRDFSPPLANYAYTKDDQPWGKHIAFYPRSREEERYRIGDSIDNDRRLIGWDIKFGPLEGINSYFNFRNVNRATDNKFLENIYRYETSSSLNSQLFVKFLYIFDNRCKTDTEKSQDTNTISGAFRFDFTKEFSWEQTFERTNEYPGFPDGLSPWLNINPEAPYPYFYLYKTRLILKPEDWLEFALEHVYNEFKYAATLDDFMNYSGIDTKLDLFDEISARFVYRYSRVADYFANGKVLGHHNVYFELLYDITKDSQLILKFSELGSYIYGLGWQSSVLDTQHIVRLIYEGKF